MLPDEVLVYLESAKRWSGFLVRPTDVGVGQWLRQSLELKGYTVEFTEGEVPTYTPCRDGEISYGALDPSEMKIRIRTTWGTGQSRSQKLINETLSHELAHQLAAELDSDLTEEQVEEFGRRIIAVFSGQPIES